MVMLNKNHKAVINSIIMLKRTTIIICFLLFISINSFCQSGILTDIGLTDFSRIRQLTTHPDDDSSGSFVIRSTSLFYNNLPYDKKKPQFYFLNATSNVQTNNHLSYGDNDGSIYPAVGLQQRLSVGVGANWKHFYIQLQPEFVTAANTDPVSFETYPNYGNYWARYYQAIVNKVDMFNRFGTTPITKFFPGQSSIRYDRWNMSAGVSTENIWWGPGIRNSLVMTNNAPGFLHASLNTTKPIQTQIGNFEGQFIAGNLYDADVEAPDNAYMRTVWADGIAKKPKNIRFITGINIVWEPKWIKNMYVGFATTSTSYRRKKTDNDFVPSTDADPAKKLQLGSMFLRYAMPADHAEFYFEYGRADKFATPINVFDDSIPTGYVVGVRKFVPIAKGNSFIELAFEMTHLQLPDARLIYNSTNPFAAPKAKSFYTSTEITQGYSNEAQLMGAAIGPGSNSQTVQLSWIKGLKKIGLQFERVARNKDFYYLNYFTGLAFTGDNNRYWTDLSYGLHLQWDYHNFLFSAACSYTSALNYRWIKLDGGYQGASTSDKQNTFISLSVAYMLKTAMNKD